MHAYRFCGAVVGSRVALPLPAATGTDEAPLYVCGMGDVLPPPASSPTHVWRDDAGVPGVSIWRRGQGWAIDFRAGATFSVDANRIVWSPHGSCTSAVVEHLLLDQILPLALSTHGHCILHASAVAIDGRAVLFAGPSGRGKSTLAAACAAAGGHVLADDAVGIGGDAGVWRAIGSYPGLRLWPDSRAALGIPDAETGGPVIERSAKRRIACDVTAGESLPLGRILLVQPALDGEWDLQPARAESVIDLVRLVFRMDVDDPEANLRDFDRASRLVAAGLVSVLRVPRSFAALADADNVIRSCVSPVS